MYPSTDDPDFYKNLLLRKEFYMLRADPERDFRKHPPLPDDPVAADIGRKLKIHSHQIFGRTLISPNTPYRKIHLNHATGTGKTLAAISIAQEFVALYKREYDRILSGPSKKSHLAASRETPTVFVLGFSGTKEAFVRDLLKYPEFGFITAAEREQLLKLQRAADMGLADDIRAAKEFFSSLKKRITNKSRGGFYKFYGYDAFVNRLFNTDLKLTELEAEVEAQFKKGESIDSETPTLLDVILEKIKSGEIRVNEALLKQFHNSVLICDEIHNTYNTNMKNNRGVAIQYILNSIPNICFVSMSATPLSNSPSEVVELINYLIAPERITKKEFFHNLRTPIAEKIDQLADLVRGRISFLQDTDIAYFPRREILGEPYKLPFRVGKFAANEEIPYLNFVKCPMSPIHQRTYKKYIELIKKSRAESRAESQAESRAEDDYHSIPTDGYSIYDLVYPAPPEYELVIDGVSEKYKPAAPDEIGLFRTADVNAYLKNAPQKWQNQMKIVIKKIPGSHQSVISGEFLKYDNIGKYSQKYRQLLTELFGILREPRGDPALTQKTIVYHDRVKMSGVMQIQELLYQNGFIDENMDASKSTLCCVCGETLGSHSARISESARGASQIKPHDFIPARFTTVHSNIEKTQMTKILRAYNSHTNANGHRCLILLGSKIIKESHEFSAVQNLIMVSLPVNISTMIQVFGRCIRKNSHALLPPEQRRVRIRLLVSTFAAPNLISPEIYRYIDKISDYQQIQLIMRALNSTAIDADIYRDVIMPDELLNEYFPDGNRSGQPRATLGNLYFEPATRLPDAKSADQLETATFFAYRHYDEEINTIVFMIKRLFMISPIWTYETLWEAVQKPPFGVEINPRFFDEDNFKIALTRLISRDYSLIKRGDDAADYIEKLFDPLEKIIYIPTKTRHETSRHKIAAIDKYFILFPLSENGTSPIIDVPLISAPRREITIDLTEQLRGKNLSVQFNKLRGDVIRALKTKLDADKLDYSVFFALLSLNSAVQKLILRDAISHTFQRRVGDETDETPLFAAIVRFYMFLGATIEPAPNMKLRGGTAQNKIRAMLSAPGELAMVNNVSGYFDGKYAIRLRANEDGRWEQVDREKFDRKKSAITEPGDDAEPQAGPTKNNSVVIGYFEDSDLEESKFKIRDMKINQSGDVKDKRFLARGIVCATKSKGELLSYLSGLGVTVDGTIKTICQRLQEELIMLEIQSQIIGGKGAQKYLYGWWDRAAF